MPTLLTIVFLLSLAGTVFNIARGMRDERAAQMYLMMSNPQYHKRASFFAFLMVLSFALLLISLHA